MACHAPHASNLPSLLAANARDLCLQCHQQLREDGERASSRHKPVMEGKCAVCHTSHGGDAKGFPRGDIQKICLSCHKDKTGNHPTTNHPTGGKKDPRTDKPLTCLSCHLPHFSEKTKLQSISGCGDCHK
jgi:predicted CXXCH cytochrome family protein